MSVAGSIFIGIGLFFTVVSSVGLLRLPDFFSRVHAVSKAETIGIGLVLLGLAFHAAFELVSIKLVLGAFFVFLANPIGAHLLTRAAVKGGMMPWTRAAGGR